MSSAAVLTATLFQVRIDVNESCACTCEGKVCASTRVHTQIACFWLRKQHEASLSSCNAGIGISFTVFPREEWGKQSTVASDVSPLYSHPAAYLPQSKDCTALFEKQRSVSSLMTWFTLNRSALHPLSACRPKLFWPSTLNTTTSFLTDLLCAQTDSYPLIPVFDLDMAWCKNLTHLHLQRYSWLIRLASLT